MHQETIKELRDIRQSIVSVASSHKEIAADINKLVNFLVNKE